MKVEDMEMQKINGGETVSSTFFNYLAIIVKTIYGVGQDLGGAIRRIASDNTCPL